jgi:transcription termination/antitermination protein NusG
MLMTIAPPDTANSGRCCRSHCEQLVYEQLTAKGFHLFLPKMQVWSKRAGVRHRIAIPMFPGYLFLYKQLLESLRRKSLLPKLCNDRVIRSLVGYSASNFSGSAYSLVDSATYLEVCKARGLVRILGQGWDRLAVVPKEEIQAIYAVLRSRSPIYHCPYMREGQRVRIMRGPLSGVEGIFIAGKANKGRLVLSVELLQQSVAVEVDCTDVEKA